jgi:hypothetical protein
MDVSGPSSGLETIVAESNGADVKHEKFSASEDETEKGVDWETLGKSEVHEQQEQSGAPIDAGFLRQRLQSECC